MSNTKNVQKISDKIKSDRSGIVTYADVTVSKKLLSNGEEENLCSGQKSFISIHSTDHLCQLANIENPIDLEQCNVEVLSLNEVFPSTSEDSLSDDDTSDQRKRKITKNKPNEPKNKTDTGKTTYVPTNSKSTTGRLKETVEGQVSVFSDYDISKSTLFVTGSNPGEPKMSYQDPPKKISKTMKKFLRNIDKHKNEQNTKNGEKAISKLTTMRGILKDGQSGLECTGDSVHDPDEFSADEPNIPFHMDFGPQYSNYSKNPDKNVTFNTQVVIIHFTGDLCVGQSVETLSKEKDQQARNSELRKTFLNKFNEFWPTQK